MVGLRAILRMRKLRPEEIMWLAKPERNVSKFPAFLLLHQTPWKEGSSYLLPWNGWGFSLYFSEKLRCFSNTKVKRIWIGGKKVKGQEVKTEEHKCCFLERNSQSDYLNLQNTRQAV